MVESCLTEDVLKAWQRSSLFGQPEENERSRLTNLMKFLKAEVEGEERLKLARGGFDSINPSPRACSSLEFEFLDQNVICGNIPRVSKGSILKELKRNNIWLSDMGADCPKIDILIGSDNYGKILTGQGLGSLRKYEEYGVFKEWLEEGVIEMVPDHELNSKGHYLPHHPVFKPDNVTTKIRPVFDASCKVGISPSLNDCLVKGPIIEEIPSILLRFGEKGIGVTSDIRRAFLQMELRKEYRLSPISLVGERQCCEGFRHTRVVFGVRSSPLLLGAVISVHLSQVTTEQGYVAQKLSKSFYIDNCVTSVDNERELVDFVKCSTKILADSKMDLRLWTYGPVGEVVRSALDGLNAESTSDNIV
ncbi:integrase_H2C2 domain-containing protein [Trichonephila inaurata madagascariensis]|uniref:Integrase_H2C2 domain-containing protein n=1 Tax=Trichonephila inaurata madagascariensis TaxID=2747483 RepID=A0A8X7C7H8_9ARAC|nr:integrase_H2C2 domain-containing protein [Trichonephila inaurata madagascariensis]